MSSIRLFKARTRDSVIANTKRPTVPFPFALSLIDLLLVDPSYGRFEKTEAFIVHGGDRCWLDTVHCLGCERINQGSPISICATKLITHVRLRLTHRYAVFVWCLSKGKQLLIVFLREMRVYPELAVLNSFVWASYWDKRRILYKKTIEC